MLFEINSKIEKKRKEEKETDHKKRKKERYFHIYILCSINDNKLTDRVSHILKPECYG